MDRLPITQELKFKRCRKGLYMRLSTVIRSIYCCLENPQDAERMREFADYLQPSLVSGTGCLPYISPKGRFSPLEHKVNCIFSEVSYVVLAYWEFIRGMNFQKARYITRKIKRLEWLRDNWDDLTVSGNLKGGYELIEKNDGVSLL